ncbi:MAG: hypothetical protein HY761_08975 [Candidatus Omnitrophica bacterium]|nr:hypothetical protein [Candidatus Omnitrophota bacterium]
MLILAIFLFVLLVIGLAGISGNKPELVFFLSVIGVTLLIIGTLFLFTSLYLKASPLFFIVLLFTFIVAILVVSSKVLR